MDTRFKERVVWWLFVCTMAAVFIYSLKPLFDDIPSPGEAADMRRIKAVQEAKNITPEQRREYLELIKRYPTTDAEIRRYRSEASAREDQAHALAAAVCEIDPGSPRC